MGTIFKGTETNYTTIDAPFEPAPNNTTMGGQITTWPDYIANNGYSSYYRVLSMGIWRYASSTYTNAMVGPAGNMGPELYYLHRIAKRMPSPGGDQWTTTGSQPWGGSSGGVVGPAGGYEGHFYFDYANTATANTVRKMMLLVDDSPIDPNNFYARIVKWEKPTLGHTLNSLDTQLQNRWLINDDYTSATYYATNTPSLKTSDWEDSVTATYSTDGAGGVPAPSYESTENYPLGYPGFAFTGEFYSGGTQNNGDIGEGFLYHSYYNQGYSNVSTNQDGKKVVRSSRCDSIGGNTNIYNDEGIRGGNRYSSYTYFLQETPWTIKNDINSMTVDMDLEVTSDTVSCYLIFWQNGNFFYKGINGMTGNVPVNRDEVFTMSNSTVGALGRMSYESYPQIPNTFNFNKGESFYVGLAFGVSPACSDQTTIVNNFNISFGDDVISGSMPQSPQSLVLGLSGFATDVMFGDQQVSSIHLNGKEVWYSSTYNKIRTAMQQGPVITSSDYPENTLVFARDTRSLLYYTGGNWHVVGHDGLNQIVVVESQSEATSSTTYPDNSLLYAKDTTNLLIYMGGNWHIIEN